uniref:Uncharacterized protein n=1 Tax=Corvus moneduloides TaxID=1196302 RepID=A0A8U7MAE8_CORMO
MPLAFQISSCIARRPPLACTAAEDTDGGGARQRRRGRRRNRSGDGAARPGPAAWSSLFPGLRGGCHGEIHEASAALVHLSRGGAEVAGSGGQRDVSQSPKRKSSEEKRNVLVESARLARGNIQDLAELKASEFDAVIFPGSCENFTTYLWTRALARVQNLGQNSITWQCLNFRASENVVRIAGYQVDYVPYQM